MFAWSILALSSVISSCSQENDMGNLGLSKDILESRKDSISLFSNGRTELKKKTRSYYPENDEYYSSNMWAVRELPFTISPRSNPELSFQDNGMRKELTLTHGNSTFYVRKLPATSGIPYLIYSTRSRTPLVCGQYNNNPNNKLVFVWDTEDISSGSWDLIPSSYQGYFAIENQTYLGTADPNNPWSVFNYAIEAKSNNQIGYAQYTKKPQQEFLLGFQDHFKIKNIEFDKSTAVITEREPLKVESAGITDDVIGTSNVTLHAATTVKESSYYYENGNSLLIPIANPQQKYFRPTVILGHFTPPTNFSMAEDKDSTLFMPKARYTSAIQYIEKTLSFTIPTTVEQRSLVEATSFLKNYNVSCNYTITLVLKKDNEDNEREVKLKGIWHGVIYTTSRSKPDVIVITPWEEYNLRLLNLRNKHLCPITINKK